MIDCNNYRCYVVVSRCNLQQEKMEESKFSNKYVIAMSFLAVDKYFQAGKLLPAFGLSPARCSSQTRMPRVTD